MSRLRYTGNRSLQPDLEQNVYLVLLFTKPPPNLFVVHRIDPTFGSTRSEFLASHVVVSVGSGG